MEPILTSIGAAMVAWVPLAAAGFYGFGRLFQKVDGLVTEVKELNGRLDKRMSAAEKRTAEVAQRTSENAEGLAELRGRQDRT